MRFGLLHEPDRGTYDRICYQMIIWVVNIIQVDSIQCTFWKWVGEISKILTTNQKKLITSPICRILIQEKRLGGVTLNFYYMLKLLIFPIIFYIHVPQTLGWGNSCVCCVILPCLRGIQERNMFHWMIGKSTLLLNNEILRKK